MDENKIIFDYFDWLLKMVKADDIDHKNYGSLLEMMHNIPFGWIIPNDSNRASDGAELREEFAYNYFTDIYGLATSVILNDILPSPCSMLEMMIALARRMDSDVLYDWSIGDRTSEWFWEMICSIGLDPYTDDNFDSEMVEFKIRTVINRNFRKDGSGSLFYIPGSKKDWRRHEIWEQMNAYASHILQLN